MAIFLETAMALVPVNAICKQWQVSKALVYLWISERRFPHYRVGGRGKRGKVLIEEDEFKSFLATCRVDEGELAEDGELRHIV